MDLHYHLSASDIEATRLHLKKRRRQTGAERGWESWRNVFAWAAIMFCLVLLSRVSDFYPPWVWMLAGTVLLGSALWLDAWTRSERHARWAAQFAGEYTLALTAAGISSSAPDGRVSFHAWRDVTAMEAAETGLYIYLDRDAALSVPRGILHGALDAFAEEARRLWRAYPAHAGQLLPETPAAPESPVRQVWANLHAAWRLVGFRDFDVQSFRVTRSALAALLLAELGVSGLADYIDALPAPLFNPAGIGDYAATVLLIFAWAAFIGRQAALRATLLHLLVMLLSAVLAINLLYLPLFLAIARLLPEADTLLWVLYAASMLWMAAAVFRIARRLYLQPTPAALHVASGYAVLALALTVLVPGPLYLSADADEPPAGYQDSGDDFAPGAAFAEGGEEPDVGAADAKLDVEDVFYRQPELVKQALERMKPGRRGETALYFVGFAGDGSEREFGNEVRYARDLLEERFNAAGRSLALINDADTVNEIPLASSHNLEAVLQGLAHRMDTQNDLLFLFLSSHGAQDHHLEVSLSPLQMNDLSAERLKAMLDQSGIRNRIIVVSACYSGGFLDVLKDDNSLILTASSRDHVAYGCGDTTEYTYFGEAFFVKALQHQDSFIAAFGEARRLIAERENSEGAEPSDPQIHVGRDIEKVLQKLRVAGSNGCSPTCSGESGQSPAID